MAEVIEGLVPATVAVRLGRIFGPERERLEVEGYACMVAGIEMVVHRSIEGNFLSGPKLSDHLWTVTEPTTGFSAWDGSRHPGIAEGPMAAVAFAEERVRQNGGAQAVQDEIRRHAAEAEASA